MYPTVCVGVEGIVRVVSVQKIAAAEDLK